MEGKVYPNPHDRYNFSDLLGLPLRCFSTRFSGVMAIGNRPTSVARDRHDHSSCPGFNVAFQVEYLLPGAQHQRTIPHGDRKIRPQERRLQMRMAVAVVPGLLMAIVATGREKASQFRRQIVDQTRLKFYGANTRGASYIEYMGQTHLYARLGNNAGDGGGEIVHLAF